MELYLKELNEAIRLYGPLKLWIASLSILLGEACITEEVSDLFVTKVTTWYIRVKFME